MPNLNKTQKNFRKQMEELKKDDNIMKVMIDNDSFYNNKAYQDKSKYKRKNNIIKLFYFAIILSLLTPSIINNKDLIINKIKSLKSLSENSSNNIFFNKLNSNQINQNEVGKYHKYYSEKIELEYIIMKNIINTNDFTKSDILKISEREKAIIKDINEFENYNPEEINKLLHELNIEQLYNYKKLYTAAEILSSGFQDNNIINNYNDAANSITITGLKYKEEILKIFNEINMNYTILDNDNINFRYQPIN